MRFPYLRKLKPIDMLHVQSFCFNAFQENTLVLYNEEGVAVIVDPGCSNAAEEQELSDFIRSKELVVNGIWCTHCHIDHVLGLRFVAERYNLTPIIPEVEMPMLQATERVAQMYGVSYNGSPEVAFFGESQLMLGMEKFELLQVPGHSPGHVAFYHKESEQLIAGDVLFRRSIGRTDLPGGDYNTLITSIRNVLFTLPDSTLVYPGHMETTTIGEERRHNPFLT